MSTTTTESNDILLCQCFRNGKDDHRVRIQRDPISKRFTAGVLGAALRAEVLDLGECRSTLMIAIYERGTKKRVINDLTCLLKKEPIVHACCDFRVLSADRPPPVEDDEFPCGKVLADVGRTALYSGGTLETIMRDGLGIGRLEVESCLPPPQVVDGEKETVTSSPITEPVVVLFPPPPSNGHVDDDECLPTDDDMPTVLDFDTLEELLPPPPPAASSWSCEDHVIGDCKGSSSSHSALRVPEELYAKTNSALQSIDWASTCDGVEERSVSSSCMRGGSGAIHPQSSKFLTESCIDVLNVIWDSRETTFRRMRVYPKCPHDCGVDHEYTTKAEWAHSSEESTFKHAVEFSTIFDQRMNWVWVDACALVMSGHRVILSVVNARADGPPLELQGCIMDDDVKSSNLSCVRFVLLEEGRREKELQRLRDRLMGLHKERLLHVCESLRINQTKYGGRGHAGETKEFVVERVMHEGGIDACIENAIARANRKLVGSTNVKNVTKH